MSHNGVLIRPLGDVIIIVPLLTTTAEEAERIVDTVAEAIAEVTAPTSPLPTGGATGPG